MNVTTGHKQPEEIPGGNEAAFCLLFENSPDAMLLLDGDTFVDCNQAAVALLALPLMRMMKGRWWESGLVVALLFSLLMGGNLLRPAGLPVGLQMAHFVEVFGENFIFGWIVVWLLHRRHGRSLPATG